DAIGLLDDVVVHARKDRRHQLDDGHFRAEPIPDGAQLEADHAAADDDEVVRDLGNGERADVRENPGLVELEEGELDRYGAGGNDDALCLIGGDFFSGGASRAADRFDLDDVPRPQYAASLRPRDLVLTKQKLDAARVLPHHFVLSAEHRCEIECEIP